jgi:uncharacterized protein
MVFNVILNLLVSLSVCALLYAMQKKHYSFSTRVFSALALGIGFGGAIHVLYGAYSTVTNATNAYLEIIGLGYVKLLQMIVIPLIMVSIIVAILKLKNAHSIGKISVLTIGTLLLTTMVAAAVGILMANLFHLTAVGLTSTAAEVARGDYLKGSLSAAQAVTLPSMVLSFIPSNPFLDMTGARKTSTIAVVIFSILVGLATIGLAEKKPQIFTSFENFMNVAQAIVMQLVTMILKLTPYGIFALMAGLVAETSYSDVLKLASFVLASYSAILIMFAIHLALIAVTGLNPIRYLKKILPVLAFAFTSRSSVGAIPMSIQTQTQRLGTPAGIANFAASFGATTGQNGCAGLYPAMLAVMIAPTVGIDPFTFDFIAQLIAIVAIGSIGVAGVGGGATFAALIVLSALNLPVALAGLLISIEPLIDMGRTALNVSGAITAGTVTSRLLGQTDMTVFNGEQNAELDDAEISRS